MTQTVAQSTQGATDNQPTVTTTHSSSSSHTQTQTNHVDPTVSTNVNTHTSGSSHLHQVYQNPTAVDISGMQGNIPMLMNMLYLCPGGKALGGVG